ncbi:MAG: HNH endonuclease [Flavisolibacter sp.]
MKELILHQVYKIASNVEDAVDIGVPLNLDKKKDLSFAQQRASSFHKETLLHLFIKHQFVSHYEHFFTSMTEQVADDPVELEFLEEQFDYYNVPIKFLKIRFDEFDYPITTDRQIINWYRRNEGKFRRLSEAICDEVFFILFSNRKLLHKFNENVANYFDRLQLKDTQLSIKGTLKRKAIPKWLQNAVYHRDKGRCCFCWTDLSKLVNLDAKNNFDHIIPLDLYGINDPTNIQLVCKDCNLNKLNRNTDFGKKYQEWFV